MTIFYGVACGLSIILLVAYFFTLKKKEKWLLRLFISIFICNTGYFLLSLSRNLTFALISNSIAYIGNIFLPFFMLMLVLNVCKIHNSKILTYILIPIGLIMLLIATSGGYLPIYYKEVELQIIKGGAKLVKEYGPLHSLYFVYLFGYMVSMVAILIYSIIHKKITSKMHASFLCVIVFGNILVWLIEQFIPHNFEFLCISYILNECLLLFLYGMIQEYEYIRIKEMEENIPVKVDLSVLNFENKLTEEQVALVFTNWQEIINLTKREKEILKHMLLGEKRKEIADKLFVSESAIKKHISSILKKLDVENSKKLIKKAISFI